MLVRILRKKLKRNTTTNSTSVRNNNKIIEIYMKYGEYFSYFPEMLKKSENYWRINQIFR